MCTMERDLSARIALAVDAGFKICVILRGLPGRGKTYLTRQLIAKLQEVNIDSFACAADDFMVNSIGEYEFNIDNLSICHSLCTSKLVEAMLRGVSVIIQHNTSCMSWESSCLRSNAEEIGYLCLVLEPEFAWCKPTDLPCEQQNILINSHGVPLEKIVEMSSRKQEVIPRYLALWLRRAELMQIDSVNCGMGQLTALHPIKDSCNKKPMLHITMDYFGLSPALKDGEKLAREIQDSALASADVCVTALYADCRGIGAIVTSAANQLDAPTYYQRYLDEVGGGEAQAWAGVQRAPHITLHVGEEHTAEELGRAACEFNTAYHDLLQATQIEGDSGTYSGEFKFGVVQTIGSFAAVVFAAPVPVKTLYAGSYAPALPNKFSRFQWKYSSATEKQIYVQMIDRIDVHVVEAEVPAAVLPGGWRLADFRISPKRGMSDDELYANSAFFRENLPRGLCLLVSPENTVKPVIVGLKKFTGSEDDSDCSFDTSLFFSRPMTTAACPRLLVMEKANGEAGHASFARIGAQLYVIAGSKNVHLMVRVGHPEDIQHYQGPRFSIASEIVTIFLETLASIGCERADSFAEHMLREDLTAIFEYEDPAHVHIVPFHCRRLKFITFVRNNRQLATAGEDISTPRVESMSADTLMSPDDMLRFAEDHALDTVWHFECPVNQLQEVQNEVLTTTDLRFEGCVLYFLDNHEVLGMIKCKNSYYICSRAVREKICTYLRKLELANGSFGEDNMSKCIGTILGCDSAAEKLTALTSSLDRMVQNFKEKSMAKEAHGCQVLLGQRLQEIATEQVPMSSIQLHQWQSVCKRFVDQLSCDWSQLVIQSVEKYVPLLMAQVALMEERMPSDSSLVVPSNIHQQSADPAEATERTTKRKKRNVQHESVPHDILLLIRGLQSEISGAVANYQHEDVRRRWPYFWDNYYSLEFGSADTNFLQVEDTNI